MKRRDFLKNCGAAVAGFPAIAVGATNATFPDARPGFVPAVVIPDLESLVHWDRFAYRLHPKETSYTSNVDEITCPICKECYERSIMRIANIDPADREYVEAQANVFADFIMNG